jgi:hypothetical protein
MLLYHSTFILLLASCSRGKLLEAKEASLLRVLAIGSQMSDALVDPRDSLASGSGVVGVVPES